jgi:PIN domain nuclease of toxin-antitoxin system
MKILIDTHILLWAFSDSNRLRPATKKVLLSYDTSVFVSAISFWEISLKYSLGKLTLFSEPEELMQEAINQGWEILELNAETTSTFHHLPTTAHKDPFDRMLIWQAMQGQYTLLSQDASFKLYQPFGLRLMLNEEG